MEWIQPSDSIIPVNMGQISEFSSLDFSFSNITVYLQPVNHRRATGSLTGAPKRFYGISEGLSEKTSKGGIIIC